MNDQFQAPQKPVWDKFFVVWSSLFALLLWFFVWLGMLFGFPPCEALACIAAGPLLVLAQPIAFIPRAIFESIAWMGDVRSFVLTAVAVKYLVLVLLGLVPTTVVLWILRRRISVESYGRTKKCFVGIFVAMILCFVGSSFYHNDLLSYQQVSALDRICKGNDECERETLGEGAFSPGHEGLRFPDVRVKTLSQYSTSLSPITDDSDVDERSRYCDEWGEARESVLECRFAVGLMKPGMLTKEDCWIAGDLSLKPAEQENAVTVCREYLGFTPIEPEAVLGFLGGAMFTDASTESERKRFYFQSWTPRLSLYSGWGELGVVSGRAEDSKEHSYIQIVQMEKQFGQTLVDDEHIDDFQGAIATYGPDNVTVLSHKTEIVGGVPMRLISLRYELPPNNGFVAAFEYQDSYMFITALGQGDVADSALLIAEKIVVH